MRVAVIGGSLGGLTVGNLLRDAGVEVTVHERSPSELEQRGAGIGFLEASYRYLVERAGLQLAEVSVSTDHIRYLARDGSIEHDEEHRYLFSSWNTVYRRLLAHFDADRYRLGSELTGFDQDADGVTVRFADGSTQRCDLLVCADGVGSMARSMLLPDAGPAYAGYVAWRGMVPERELPGELADALGDAITYHVGANTHILVYPIPGLDGSTATGHRLVNFVWYRNYRDGGDLGDLMTDRAGRRRDISLPPGAVRADHEAEARAVAAARLPRQLGAVVCGADELFVQVIYDIEVPRMAFGRVCLLGDAAFAVRPHAAAGTAKAAADGWALVEAIQATDDVESALGRWEPVQLDLGRSLLERTRAIGRRSQIDGTWQPGDPELIFGLFEPGR